MRPRHVVVAVALACAALGCGGKTAGRGPRDAGSGGGGQGGSAGTDGAGGGTAGSGGAGGTGGQVTVADRVEPGLVYATDSTQLYTLDLDAAPPELKYVASFRWPREAMARTMTDFAIDGEGRLWGVSTEYLFRVHPRDGTLALETTMPRDTLGLAALAGGKLLVTTKAGTLHSWDTATQTMEKVGEVDGQVDDAVYVPGVGVLLSMLPDGGPTGQSVLARADGTPIDATGFWYTTGLAVHGDRVVAVTVGGDVALLDPASADGRRVLESRERLTGAASSP